MDSGGGPGGGNAGDQNALLESSSYHHHQHPFVQSRGNGNHQNHIPTSTKIIIRKIIPYFIALFFACFVIYHSSGPANNLLKGNLSPLFNTSSTRPAPENLQTYISSPMHPQENEPSSPASEDTEETKKLEKVLNRAAMENRTVVVTTINAAWTKPDSIFDLLLESFKIGNGTRKFLNHLVVIALDQESYNRCSELHQYCYALRTDGIDFSLHEALYKQPDYSKLVWRKVEFMHTIIKLGYNSIFTDADIMWFRDPFLHFLEDADIQTASEHYGGNPTSKNGRSNTGFYYVKSNDRTIQFYEFWLATRHKFPKKHDQQVFNMIRFDPLTEKIGVMIRLLDTVFYGGFPEPSMDLNLVCTMHANSCLGLVNKTHDLRLLIDDWKKYKALSSDERVKTPHTWTPGICH